MARDPECIHYPECLGALAHRKLRSLDCEGCGRRETREAEEDVFVTELKRGGTMEEKPVKMCSRCNEKPTISPTSPFCASCMNKVRWEKAGSKDMKVSKDRPKKTQPRPDLEVIVSFKRYPEVLAQIRALSEEEMRPLDVEIIFILKCHLKVERGSDAVV